MTGISVKEALEILRIDTAEEMEKLLDEASAAREAFAGDRVTTCSIVNARCGGCPENCAFCAQSGSSNTDVSLYQLIPPEEILEAAGTAENEGACRLGIVTSGRSVTRGKEADKIMKAVSMITEKLKIAPCASLGLMDRELLSDLKAAGLKRYHNNLETAESFFSEICTTRSYSEQTATIENAKYAGLEVCCGGIFGMGETNAQRIEMLETIRALDIDSVPVNFLTPIPGTKLENADYLTPEDCLKIIAAARLMMPDKSIRLCGGREYNLKERQKDIFRAGADAIMTGGYLVTAGNSPEEDRRMMQGAGMKQVSC